MNRPDVANLLVIGAARSGTTALCLALARHDDVYLTDPKESHFLAFADRAVAFEGPGDDEMMNTIAVTDPEDWRRLCAPGAGHRYICEGSVSTLFHHDSAVANIARYADPGCRLVVVLRDPVERAFSSYLYLLARGYETAPTFEDALAAEPDRAAWHHLWHYEAMSHYGPQLQAFVDGFGRDALYVFTHEQLRSDRAGTLRGLCDWLDLEPGPVLADQAEVNIGGVPRSSLLQGAVHRARGSVLKPIVKRLTSRRLRERVRTANLDRPTLDPALRASLWPRFADDVAVVETLLGRPVSEWTASGTN